MSPSLEIFQVDYDNTQQAEDLVSLLDHYAQDPMGGGGTLSDSVKQTLVSNLRGLSYAVSFLAYQDTKPVGLVNAFESFSTFANEPLINIHDLVVLDECRGQGIAQHMLMVVEEFAKVRGCCKLTLEVLTGNTAAQTLYKHFGFAHYALDPSQGEAVFLEKKLS